MTLIVLAAVGFLRLEGEANHREKQADKTDHQAAVNRRQFCRLILDRHEDTIIDVTNTVAYLRSPAGKKMSPFNTFINTVTIPQTLSRATTEEATMPPICEPYRAADPDRYHTAADLARAVQRVQTQLAVITNRAASGPAP